MKAGVIDDRMFDLIACHEAAHVLRAWDAGYAVAVVELDAHRGNVLLEEEPWDNPAASWAISKAGREACGQLFDRWDTESVEDKLYSGAPGGLHQLRQWQSALNAWMGLFVPVKTPKPGQDALARALAQIARDPALAAGLEKTGMALDYRDPAATMALLERESATVAKLVERLKLPRE